MVGVVQQDDLAAAQVACCILRDRRHVRSPLPVTTPPRPKHGSKPGLTDRYEHRGIRYAIWRPIQPRCCLNGVLDRGASHPEVDH